MKVLLAEDDSMQAEVYKTALIQLGCTVDLARDGVEAFEMSQKTKYAAIITDYGMPIMDGLAFLQALARRRSSVPILFHSADASINDLPIEEFGRVFDNVTGHRKCFDHGKSRAYITEFISSVKK